IFHRVEPLGVAQARLRGSFLVREVLQLALARLVADRAVERMIYEQHLEHALARFERLLRIDVHHLTFSRGGRTGRRELGRLLDVHQAHAAVAGDRKSRVVAVARDENTRALASLENRCPFGNRNRTPLDGEIHHLRLRYRRGRLRGCSHLRHRRGNGVELRLLDQGFELRTELVDAGYNWNSTGIAEHADRLASHVVGDAEERIEIFVGALAIPDPLHDLGGPRGAFATLRALRTALVREESCCASDLLHHVLLIVEDDYAAGAEHRALLDEALVIHFGGFGFFHRLDRNRDSTRNYRLERATRERTTAQVVKEILERKAKRHFIVAGLRDVATYGEQFRAGALGTRERQALVPFGAAHDDVRNGRERLDVVDRSRLGEDAGHRGERRLDARIAAPAFDGVHHRGLFTADVRASTLVDHNVDALAASHRVLADDASVVGLANCLAHANQRLRELAANVDVRGLGADRVGTDRATFDERVRSPAHDLTILERAGLGLVGVAAQVVRLAVAWLHEGPLDSRREARAATAAEPRSLDHVDDFRRRHRKRLLKSVVA